MQGSSENDACDGVHRSSLRTTASQRPTFHGLLSEDAVPCHALVLVGSSFRPVQKPDPHVIHLENTDNPRLRKNTARSQIDSAASQGPLQ